MVILLKVLLSSITLATCFYAAGAFGIGIWTILFFILGVFLLLSVYFKRFYTASVMMARAMGVLSLVAFLLLMLAATVGGSFNLSESNKVVAVSLAVMTVLGCAFFLVKSKHSGENHKSSE
ncbi:hypothetical protein GCM10009123_03040 [Kangiella japonica]|uniref:Uncharacterized protein n=1 Tax=Kangiella japonica TaxID=647384 RepID=A0ABN0STT5_9GAMM